MADASPIHLQVDDRSPIPIRLQLTARLKHFITKEGRVRIPHPPIRPAPNLRQTFLRETAIRRENGQAEARRSETGREVSREARSQER